MSSKATTARSASTAVLGCFAPSGSPVPGCLGHGSFSLAAAGVGFSPAAARKALDCLARSTSRKHRRTSSSAAGNHVAWRRGAAVALPLRRARSHRSCQPNSAQHPAPSSRRWIRRSMGGGRAPGGAEPVGSKRAAGCCGASPHRPPPAAVWRAAGVAAAPQVRSLLRGEG